MADKLNNVKRAEIDITAYEGDTFDAILEFKDKVSNTPLNFAGCTFLMQIRDKNGVLKQSLSDTSGFSVVGGVITFNAIITAVSGIYTYDLQVTYPDSKQKTLIGGLFNVIKQTTKP